jgi:hypothetical protein
MPIDANNIILEQAFARFLVLVRTKGRPITSTTKDTLHPEDLVEIVRADTNHFQGINGEPQRQRLLEHWKDPASRSDQVCRRTPETLRHGS